MKKSIKCRVIQTTQILRSDLTYKPLQMVNIDHELDNLDLLKTNFNKYSIVEDFPIVYKKVHNITFLSPYNLYEGYKIDIVYKDSA